MNSIKKIISVLICIVIIMISAGMIIPAYAQSVINEGLTTLNIPADTVFTPQYDGYYVIGTEGANNISVHESNGSGVSSTIFEGINSYYLCAYQSYQIEMKLESGNTYNSSQVYLTHIHIDNGYGYCNCCGKEFVYDASNGSSVNVSFSPWNRVCIKYIPSSDGYYTIESNSNNSRFAETVIDSRGTSVNPQDLEYNQSPSYYLNTGEQYTIVLTHNYFVDVSESITVTHSHIPDSSGEHILVAPTAASEGIGMINCSLCHNSIVSEKRNTGVLIDAVITNDGFGYEVFEDSFSTKEISLIGYWGNNSNIIMPDDFGGIPVTSIGNYSKWEFHQAGGFHNVEYITRWPSNIRSISSYSFMLSSIKEIYIPDSVKMIGAHAFRNCANLRTVSIGSTTQYIGEYAFYGDATAFSAVAPIYQSNMDMIDSNIREDDNFIQMASASGLSDYLIMFTEIKMYHLSLKFYFVRTLDICNDATQPSFLINNVNYRGNRQDWASRTYICDGNGYLVCAARNYSDNSGFNCEKLIPNPNSALMIERRDRGGNIVVETNNPKVINNNEYLPGGVTSVIAADDSGYGDYPVYAENAPEYDSWFIYGIEPYTTPDELIALIGSEDYNCVISNVTGSYVGTGTIVKIFDKNGNFIEQFRVVIYGDLDNSGSVTSSDTNIAIQESKRPSWSKASEEDRVPYMYRAANVDQSTSFSSSDANLLIMCNKNKAEIDQVSGRVNSKNESAGGQSNAPAFFAAQTDSLPGTIEGGTGSVPGVSAVKANDSAPKAIETMTVNPTEIIVPDEESESANMQDSVGSESGDEETQEEKSETGFVSGLFGRIISMIKSVFAFLPVITTISEKK